MKAPASTSTSSSSSSSGSSSSSSSGSTFSTAAAAKQYIADSRNELASAARETVESKTQAARAAHSRAEAAADTAKAKAHAKAGDTAAAKRELADAARDNARAARDTARSQRDAVRASRNKVKAKANAIKARTVSLALPGAVQDGWILGGNDGHRGCAAVAVANSLLLSSGLRASDEDVLALYLVAAGGDDSGASILATLEAAAESGLCGARPAFELSTIQNVDSSLMSGLILDLELQEAQQGQVVWDWEPSPSWGEHAAVLAGDSVITWGREVPVTADFLAGQVAGAWRVEWVGQGT